MMNSSVKNGKEKAKEKEKKIGGSSDKEQPPVGQVFLADIKSLRSIFEPEPIRKAVKQSNPTPPPDEPPTKPTPTVPQLHQKTAAGHDEDVVDCSQPSMEDLLTKFRRLELEADKMRNAEGGRARKLQADEYVQRSASLDRKSNLTYDRTKVKEPSSSTVKGLTIDERLEAAKTAKRSTGQQPQKPPAKLLPEAKTDSGTRSSKKEPDTVANGYTVSVDSIKRSLGGAAVKQTVDKQVEHEELPSEGTVKALLSRWKSMENIKLSDNSPRKKKRVSFGVDSSWLPDDQPTPVNNNKAPKPNKSCLKLKTPPTTAAAGKKNDKPTAATTAHDSKKTFVHEDNKVPSKAPKSTSIQPLRRSNSTNSHRPRPTSTPPPPPPPPPPDIVSQVSQVETKPADELPPPSNTKALLRKFRAMQVKTST